MKNVQLIFQTSCLSAIFGVRLETKDLFELNKHKLTEEKF